MNDRQRKLEQAVQLCDEVIDLLDRAYLSHCKDAGVDPDPEIAAKYMTS